MLQDFANAIDKMSRSGYKGEHGNFTVPDEDINKLDAIYMQVTVGDYGTLCYLCSVSATLTVSYQVQVLA